jgi:hypothetical protein
MMARHVDTNQPMAGVIYVCQIHTVTTVELLGYLECIPFVAMKMEQTGLGATPGRTKCYRIRSQLYPKLRRMLLHYMVPHKGVAVALLQLPHDLRLSPLIGGLGHQRTPQSCTLSLSAGRTPCHNNSVRQQSVLRLSFRPLDGCLPVAAAG